MSSSPRRLVLLVVAAAATIAIAAAQPAPAATPIESTLRFTSAEPGFSTGLRGTVRIGSAARPATVRQLTIALPAGSAIALNTVPQCTAPRDERVGRGHATVCGPETRIGTGRANIVVDGRERTVELELWNVKAGDSEVVNVEQQLDGQRLPPFTVTVAGRTLAVPLGGSMLTRLTLSVPAIGGEDEWNKDVGPLISTPARCPKTESRRFVLAVAMVTTDGERRVARSRSRCD